MWKVVFLVCVAVVTVSSDPQSSSASSASSAASCGGGSCAQSVSSSAAAASGGSSCRRGGGGGGRCGNPPRQCGPNETFDPCPATCPPRQCGVDPALILCAPNPEYGDPECKPGCRCIDGYLRNENECIPKDSCPKPGCNGDPNASPGCGVNCGKTCATYNSSEPVFCTDICYENGCDCNKGYVFDPAVKRCVLPEDCTPKCGTNEIPSNCSNGGCGPFTCADLGSPIKCVKPQKCEVGCVCQDKYVRNANGTCVPNNQCPAPKCGSNQKYCRCRPRSTCQKCFM